MDRPQASRSSASRLFAWCLILAVLTGLVWWQFKTPTFGAELGPRSLQLSEADVSATSDYQLTFDTSTAGTLGSVDVQFCANDPLLDDVCTVPSGLDVSGATIVDQDGPGDFTIDPATTANDLKLTRTPSNVAVGTIRIDFTNVINPDTAGSYYARVQTFASADGSGPASDYGGIAFAINNGVSINATVPPFLIFCTGVTITGLDCANANGDYIDLGELSETHASSASSQMLILTNSGSGYAITVNGTTLSSGVNTINALSANDVSRPGTSQFGFNLRTNTTPPDGDDPSGPGTAQPVANYNQPDSYRFNDGDTLVNISTIDNVRQFTSSYIVNVPHGQAPGIYVTTLTYIAVADF